MEQKLQEFEALLANQLSEVTSGRELSELLKLKEENRILRESIGVFFKEMKVLRYCMFYIYFS